MDSLILITMKDFKLPTLENRRKTYDLVLAYKIINGYTYVPNKILNISNRESNHSKIRIISKIQSKFSSKSFVNRTTIAWNVFDKVLFNPIPLSYLKTN